LHTVSRVCQTAGVCNAIQHTLCKTHDRGRRQGKQPGLQPTHSQQDMVTGS
jgi:hypothetical protein